MKKKVLSALLAATMVVSMTACGGAKTDEGSADKPDTQAPATEADTSASEDAIANLIASTEGDVNITLWCSEQENYQKIMTELTDKFKEQYSDVNFNIKILLRS